MTDLPTTIEAEIAKELVKAMIGGLTGLVKKVPTLFRRSGKAKEELVAADIDRSIAELTAATGAERERQQIRHEATWETRLRDLLAEYPDAEAQLRTLQDEIRTTLAQTPAAVTVYQQHNEHGGGGAQGPGATVNIYHT